MVVPSLATMALNITLGISWTQMEVVNTGGPITESAPHVEPGLKGDGFDFHLRRSQSLLPGSVFETLSISLCLDLVKQALHEYPVIVHQGLVAGVRDTPVAHFEEALVQSRQIVNTNESIIVAVEVLL